MFKVLDIFKGEVVEECFYFVSIEPNQNTIDQVKALQDEISVVENSIYWETNTFGPLMPLLCFTAEIKYEAQLESMIMYELAGVNLENMAQLGPVFTKEERGLIGFELVLSTQLIDTIAAIKLQLVDLFDVDDRYFSIIDKACLVIAKNLSPVAFSFGYNKLVNHKGFSLGYESLMFGKSEKVNRFKTIRKQKLV